MATLQLQESVTSNDVQSMTLHRALDSLHKLLRAKTNVCLGEP